MVVDPVVGEEDELELEDVEELDDELEEPELCAVEMGGDIGELCSGL